jgi:predicted DNA-binding protein
MKQNDAVMNIRIATELHDQLKALAKKKYMPLSVMVRLALIDYITHEAPSVLLSTSQPQTPQRKPMSAQEFKFMREQQMRGADISAIRPQSPSQQNDLSEDDWA